MKAVWVVLLAGALSSCGTCREYGEPLLYVEGSVDGNVYVSARAGEPWLFAPGGRRYRIPHGLPSAPGVVLVYLSFDEFPGGESEVAATLGAGNSAIIESVDDEALVFQNDSCSDFFVRVVAVTGEDAAAAEAAASSKAARAPSAPTLVWRSGADASVVSDAQRAVAGAGCR